MMYALSKMGDKIGAAQGAVGFCQYCRVQLVPRCVGGSAKYAAHWAHPPKPRCDPWWEKETDWHRRWKSVFPERFREVIHIDGATGEKHVADVKTDRGVVIEFQNSPMDPEELRSREDFYRSLIWVVNAERFRRNFYILDPLPGPGSEFTNDIVFCPQRADWLGRAFGRWSENPGKAPGDGELVLMHSMEEIREEIEQHYIGHHLFDWIRPRSVWFEARAPVYFDFGSNALEPLTRGFEFRIPRSYQHPPGGAILKLDVFAQYGRYPLYSVQYVSKRELVEANGGSFEGDLPDDRLGSATAPVD